MGRLHSDLSRSQGPVRVVADSIDLSYVIARWELVAAETTVALDLVAAASTAGRRQPLRTDPLARQGRKSERSYRARNLAVRAGLSRFDHLNLDATAERVSSRFRFTHDPIDRAAIADPQVEVQPPGLASPSSFQTAVHENHSRLGVGGEGGRSAAGIWFDELSVDGEQRVVGRKKPDTIHATGSLSRSHILIQQEPLFTPNLDGNHAVS
jgi:hypothetical protein